MFKRLRNKLLVVNTLIIAALILGSFSVIFAITYSNVRNGINSQLEHGLQMVRGPEFDKPDNAAGRGDKPLPINSNPDKRRNFSPAFSLRTDEDGNILTLNSIFSIESEFYKDIISDVIDKYTEGAKLSGTVRELNNEIWEYRAEKTPEGYSITFLEISSERAFLRNLIIALLIVGIAALSAAFLISLYFANGSIRPVEESYNRQKQFIADASHELKTPLTTINTNVDVLLSRDDTDAEERKWLGYVKDETERMTKLTNDLLYLAKLDHGSEAGVMLSRVSFSEAAESVILLMEAVIFEKNINMSYDITPDLYVKGSNEQLKQLVMILLDNAVKYTPKDGDIKITLARDSSDASFVIRNTGEGIAEDAQKQIFERFYREDRSRSRESGGYGLGLAIARAITTTCGGSIRVSSKKNEFTEFTVKIPLSK